MVKQKTPDGGVDHLKNVRSFSRIARSSVAWAYLRTGVHALVSLPGAMVLARLLSPADFGIAATAVFFSQLAGRIGDSGMGQALVRIKELRDEHVSTVFTLSLLMGIAGALTLVPASPYIAAFYGTPAVGSILNVAAMTFAVAAFATVPQALLNRRLRYRELATITSVEITVTIAVAVFLAFLGFRYWSLVIGDLVGAVVRCVWAVVVVRWHFKLRFFRSAARELVPFASGSYAQRVLEYFSQNVDNLIIGRTLGMASLGFYDKAFSTVNRFFKQMIAVGPNVSFRILAIIQDERERFRLAFRKVVMTAALICYPALAVLGTAGPHLVVVLFGDKWRPAIVPLQLLCWASVLRLLNVYASVAAQARGYIWPQVWRQIVQVVFIIVGVYLASSWGINWAAAAVLFSTIVMFVLTQSMLGDATGIHLRDMVVPQVPAIVCASGIVAILWGIDLLFGLAPGPISQVLVLGVQLSAGGCYALVFAWWCPFRDVRELLHDVVSDMSPRMARVLFRDIHVVGNSSAGPTGIAATTPTK